MASARAQKKDIGGLDELNESELNRLADIYRKSPARAEQEVKKLYSVPRPKEQLAVLAAVIPARENFGRSKITVATSEILDKDEVKRMRKAGEIHALVEGSTDQQGQATIRREDDGTFSIYMLENGRVMRHFVSEENASKIITIMGSGKTDATKSARVISRYMEGVDAQTAYVIAQAFAWATSQIKADTKANGGYLQAALDSFEPLDVRYILPEIRADVGRDMGQEEAPAPAEKAGVGPSELAMLKAYIDDLNFSLLFFQGKKLTVPQKKELERIRSEISLLETSPEPRTRSEYLKATDTVKDLRVDLSALGEQVRAAQKAEPVATGALKVVSVTLRQDREDSLDAEKKIWTGKVVVALSSGDDFNIFVLGDQYSSVDAGDPRRMRDLSLSGIKKALVSQGVDETEATRAATDIMSRIRRSQKRSGAEAL